MNRHNFALLPRFFRSFSGRIELIRNGHFTPPLFPIANESVSPIAIVLQIAHDRLLESLLVNKSSGCLTIRKEIFVQFFANLFVVLKFIYIIIFINCFVTESERNTKSKVN